MPYDQLPEEVKESNRDTARDILHKLELSGYELVHARSNQIPLNFPGETLGQLAEEEHVRWMQEKLRSPRTPAWHYGAPRNDEKGKHPSLLPWRMYSEKEWQTFFTDEERQRIGEGLLPESEKTKDYDIVRGIPAIVARAGYAVVKAHAADEG
jgi:hypothetical protein